MNSFIPYGKQSIFQDDIKEVVKTLKSDYLTQGPAVGEFENQLCKYTGAKYCVAVNSGTAALHTAYFALGLGKGDEFITSPMTFAATANAGLYLGAKPIFVDIDQLTGNVDINKIDDAVTKKTKLISVIHYGGLSVDMKHVQSIAKKHKLLVVEDACHTLGGEYRNEKVGSCHYSDVCIFSFHPVKHITTGEGGAILTNRRDVYEKALMFRSHGITKEESQYESQSCGAWYHEMQHLGYNYRLSDILAALGVSQLAKIDKFIRRRRKIAGQYRKLLNNFNYISLPSDNAFTKHAYHLYPIRLDKTLRKHKKQIFTDLHRRGLGVQTHYIPVYQHPYYRKHGYKNTNLKMAELFYRAEISLPMYYSMSMGDVNRVSLILKEVIMSYV